MPFGGTATRSWEASLARIALVAGEDTPIHAPVARSRRADSSTPLSDTFIVDTSFVDRIVSDQESIKVAFTDTTYFAALSKYEEALQLAIDVDAAPRGDVVSTPNLYPLREITSPDIALAMTAADAALVLVNEVIDATEKEIFFQADDALQRLAATLPDLFLCNSLGEGFSALVVALHYAIVNPRDAVLSLDQAQEIRLALRYLKERPFMKHELAIERIVKLEDAGLIVDPILDTEESDAEELPASKS